jgi:hypothetical protein
MVLSSAHGSRNERAVNRDTFFSLKRDGLTKSRPLWAIIEIDSTLLASQSFEINSSAALGMPSLYFGKGAIAVIFMDSQRFCTASLRRKCCELVSKSFTVSSIRGVDANPRATTLSQYLQKPGYT